MNIHLYEDSILNKFKKMLQTFKICVTIDLKLTVRKMHKYTSPNIKGEKIAKKDETKVHKTHTCTYILQN